MNRHRIIIIDQINDLVTFNLNRQYACVFFVKLFYLYLLLFIWLKLNITYSHRLVKLKWTLDTDYHNII